MLIEADKTQQPALEGSDTSAPAMESALARVYNLGLGVGAGVFVIGLLLSAFGLVAPWVFWVGIGALTLVPGVAAAQSALNARRAGDAEIVRSILLTAAALLSAVVLGLILSRR